MELLLSYGADDSARDACGRAPLDVAHGEGARRLLGEVRRGTAWVG